ncbi:MAG: response regulator, partial [Nitrospira sp.]
PLDIVDGIGLPELLAKRTTGLMQPQLAPAIERATRKQFPDGIAAYGTDALRFTFASLATQSRDLRFDLGRVAGYRNFCNKLWNAARFVLMSTEAPLANGPEEFSAYDRWIRSRLHGTIAAVREAFTAYRFDLAAQAVYEFTWYEFCDWYLEFSKPVLQSDLMDAMLTALTVESGNDQTSSSLVTRHSVREQSSTCAASGLTILLAEDHPVNQALATRLLQKWGHHVMVAGNGREALAALDAQAFDLLLTDIQMPEMDGLALATAIRAREATGGTHLPIIAMTAHALKGDRERCLAAGMDAYVAKPLQPAELTKVMADLMPSRPAAPPLPSAAPAPEADRATAFDYESALGRVEGDRALLVDMLNLYLDSSVKLTALIQDTLRSQDARGLERAAHTVKGAVGTLSAQKAFEAAVRLEECAKARDFRQAGEAWSTLEQELQCLRHAIDSLMKQETR